MIGEIISAGPASNYEGDFVVIFDCLGYWDYRDTIAPWANENLFHGIKFQPNASVLLFDASDYALFMLGWA